MVYCVAYNCPNGSASGWSMNSFPSMARSVGYEIERVRLTEDAIPTILGKLGDANSKQISGLMEKLNRKWVCMTDNRKILGANYWTFTSSRILESLYFK